MNQSPPNDTWPDPSLEWDLIKYFFMRPSVPMGSLFLCNGILARQIYFKQRCPE